MSYYAERVGDPGEPNPEWHGDAVASHREIQALIRENSKLRGDKNELACEVSRLREAGNAVARELRERSYDFRYPEAMPEPLRAWFGVVGHPEGLNAENQATDTTTKGQP